MLRLLNSLFWIALTVYLCIGAGFAILPFLFGAYSVAFQMLVGWPAIYFR